MLADGNDFGIVHADALTCLGHGNDLRLNLLNGVSGLTPAGDSFSQTELGENGGYVGTLSDISGEIRLPAIFERGFTKIVPACFFDSDLIIGACSIGDLSGSDAGNPRAALGRALVKFSEQAQIVPPFSVISSACSSGTDALIMACNAISSGCADVVGVLSFDSLGAGKLMQHVALGTQSRERARPFDINRSGTSFGEAFACVLVANKAGRTRLGLDQIGSVAGFGMSNDAHDITAPYPSGDYAALAVRNAVKGVPISEVGYINAHGSGTNLNDVAEAAALYAGFGGGASSIPISSTKGALGHSLGATGLVEAVVTLQAINARRLPPTYGLEEPDTTLGLNYILSAQETHTQYGLSVTFGFGGVNSAVLMRAGE